MYNYSLRECRTGDEQALSLVAAATILEAYAPFVRGENLYRYIAQEMRPEKFETFLGDPSMRVWMAELEPTRCVIGYAHARRDEVDPLAIELKRLYILDRFRGLGIGKRLMDASVEFASLCSAQALLLRVHHKNEDAIGFYLGYGFQTVDEEPFEAGDEIARVLVMRRNLPPLQ